MWAGGKTAWSGRLAARHHFERVGVAADHEPLLAIAAPIPGACERRVATDRRSGARFQPSQPVEVEIAPLVDAHSQPPLLVARPEAPALPAPPGTGSRFVVAPQGQ